jgi:hypothetical protein
MTRVLNLLANSRMNYFEILYANNFPDWFVGQAMQRYDWAWLPLLIDLRRGNFFLASDGIGGTASIVPGQPYPSPGDTAAWGESLTQRLAAFAATLPGGEDLVRSLQLDGFDVDKVKWRLLPFEGPVSAQKEEDRLSKLVNNSGLPNSGIILKHSGDAFSEYTEGKYHESLNQSRNLIQASVDGISIETDTHGKHSTKLPGGTSNRIGYLKDVGFLTPDEQSAFNSAWGTLSTGSHPGVPEREQARIGLILALEFGQLLIIKFTNWKSNAYQKFS